MFWGTIISTANDIRVDRTCRFVTCRPTKPLSSRAFFIWRNYKDISGVRKSLRESNSTAPTASVQKPPLLNKTIAAINTVFLLTGGYFAARAVYYFKAGLYAKTNRFFGWAIISGLAFLVLKIVEYHQKLEAGLTMNYSSFFMNYWLLTAFHWLHVLVGVVILFFIRRGIQQKKEKASLDDIEAGTAFWHMCDLIWLLLFPILYLLF